jgi:transcriptional regulator with XRE-family HTH domain
MSLADVHRTQISNYERGETEPQAEVLARLSRALGVSAEEFFAGVGWQGAPPRLLIPRVDEQSHQDSGIFHSPQSGVSESGPR